MLDSLLTILKNSAPSLATVVTGPMGGLAVKMIADKLGVEDKTVEGLTSALKSNPELELKLKEIDYNNLVLRLKDLDSARNREVMIATNEQSPVLNKIVPAILALGVVTLSFILFSILIFVQVQENSKDILIYILGVLSAAVTQILSYYFGSSLGSKDKSEELKGLFK